MRTYLPELVYGANDGVVTTLAVVSGVTGAQLSTTIILILGFANLFADGVSMGASNVLAERSTLAEVDRPSLQEASKNGLATFSGFLVAGVVPLLAYLLPFPEGSQFAWACGLSALTLFGIGAGRSLFSDRAPLMAGLEMLAIGAVAGSVAYGVGLVGGRSRAGRGSSAPGKAHAGSGCILLAHGALRRPDQEPGAGETVHLRMTIDRVEHVFRNCHVHPYRFLDARRSAYEDRNRRAVLGDAHDLAQGRGLGDRLAVLHEPFQMQRERLFRHRARLVQRSPGGDAARKVGERDAVVTPLVLVNQADIFAHGSPQLEPRLTLDALQSSHRDVPLRVRDGHPSGTIRVLQLDMATLASDLTPTGPPKGVENLGTRHRNVPSAADNLYTSVCID